MVKEKWHLCKGTDGIVSTHGQAEGQMSGSECLAGCIEDRLQKWWAGGCGVGRAHRGGPYTPGSKKPQLKFH